MHRPTNLKHDLTDRQSCSPEIKTALPLAHPHFIAGCVHTYIGRDASIESESLPAQTLLDRFHADLEMLCGDSPVVVAEAEAVVAPYYCCAPGGTTGGDAAAAFAVFFCVAAFGDEPAVGLGSGCEGAEGGWLERFCGR